MRIGLALTALAATALCAAPATAATCTLALSTAGVLALSADAMRLASNEPGGLPAAITIASIGTNTVTVSPPSLAAYPSGFDPGGASLAVAYAGAGLLSGVMQPYTGQQTSFEVPGLIGTVILSLDNRITTSTGFAAGQYQTRTVVTCS